MYNSISIDENYVRKLVSGVCIRRKNAENPSPMPPCHDDSKSQCPIEYGYSTIDWGEMVRCIGNCFIGDLDTYDWISGQPKRSLNGCLKASTNIDWLLHLSKKRYRDHSSHQLFVAALGDFLLNCKIVSTDQFTLKKWISNKSQIREEDVELAWWIASLFHDHAYPLAHMLKLTPSIFEENRSELLDQTWNLLGYGNSSHDIFKNLYEYQFLKDLRNAIENYDNSGTQDKKGFIIEIIKNLLLPSYFEENEFSDDIEVCYDHGILAAANLASFFSHAKSPIIRHIIRAIAIHNGAACPTSVDIENDPLAFLLILCDECQEWGRRIIIGDKALTESNCIFLNDLKNFEIYESFSVVFSYPNAGSLSQTGWSYPLFQKSKDVAFARLNNTNNFLSRINYQVVIPHEKIFSKS